MAKNRGQILVGVLLLMMILAIIVPAMVTYLQNEAKWSVKQGQNSNAFQLAEAAVDRGYQKITESTGTWKSLKLGNSIPNFRFDRAYDDLPGGSYTIAISSGPDAETATIIGVGRDKNLKEVRALKVVFVNSVMGGAAIDAAGGVSMSGSNVDVEWGAIMSPRYITIGTKLHPAYYSASGIDKDTDGPGGINTDANNWWWKSYYSGVPPTPFIDFMSYQSSAAASGATGCSTGSGKSKTTLNYYTDGSVDGACTDLTGKTFYVTGNWDNFDGKIIGSVIVLGNLTFQNGALTTLTNYQAMVPITAWKNYCNDWAAYQVYDPGGAGGQPACFGNVNSTYRAVNVPYTIGPAVKGFMYVGGNLSLPNGGGNSGILHGAIVVNGAADVNTNAHGRIYYDDTVAANILVTRIILTRQSWQDIVLAWPIP